MCLFRRRRRWIDAGDADLTANEFASKVTRLIATTYKIVVEWKLTTILLPAERRPTPPVHGPTTAPDAQNMVNSYIWSRLVSAPWDRVIACWYRLEICHTLDDKAQYKG